MGATHTINPEKEDLQGESKLKPAGYQVTAPLLVVVGHQSVALVVSMGFVRGLFLLFDEFDQGEGGVVAPAGFVLVYLGVTAGPVVESLGKVVEQLFRGLLVAQEGEGESSGVNVAPFGQGDDLVREPSEFFGLGLGGADALVLDELHELVAKKSFSMARGAIQLSA